MKFLYIIIFHSRFLLLLLLLRSRIDSIFRRLLRSLLNTLSIIKIIRLCSLMINILTFFWLLFRSTNFNIGVNFLNRFFNRIYNFMIIVLKDFGLLLSFILLEIIKNFFNFLVVFINFLHFLIINTSANNIIIINNLMSKTRLIRYGNYYVLTNSISFAIVLKFKIFFFTN